MLLIGFILHTNTKNKHPWKYDIVGALAHLIPLSALFIFHDVVKETMGLKVVIASSLIHAVLFTTNIIFWKAYVLGKIVTMV